MSPSVAEHLQSLELFLDVSILAGFSFGTAKAVVLVTKGSLLGHIVDRNGISGDPEKSKAIDEFAPLKDKSNVQMFLGSASAVRRYLAPHYPACVKLLTD